MVLVNGRERIGSILGTVDVVGTVANRPLGGTVDTIKTVQSGSIGILGQPINTRGTIIISNASGDKTVQIFGSALCVNQTGFLTSKTLMVQADSFGNLPATAVLRPQSGHRLVMSSWITRVDANKGSVSLDFVDSGIKLDRIFASKFQAPPFIVATNLKGSVDEPVSIQLSEVNENAEVFLLLNFIEQ